MVSLKLQLFLFRNAQLGRYCIILALQLQKQRFFKIEVIEGLFENKYDFNDNQEISKMLYHFSLSTLTF